MIAHLREKIEKNFQQFSACDPPNFKITFADMGSAAIDLEYEAFTSCKSLSVYRNLFKKMVSTYFFSYLLIFKKTSTYFFLKITACGYKICNFIAKIVREIEEL